MSRIQRFALFIDYQDHYLQRLPKPIPHAFKQNARALADQFRDKDILPVWILMQCSNGCLSHLPPHFVAAENRNPSDFQERALFSKLCFDPDLIRDDEAYLIKYGNDALAHPKNPMLDHFRKQAALIEATICGTSTTQCIASTALGAAQTPTIHRCTVLTDHLADMNFEREKRMSPDWHQQKVLSRLGDDKSKFSFLTAQDYLAKL